MSGLVKFSAIESISKMETVSDDILTKLVNMYDIDNSLNTDFYKNTLLCRVVTVLQNNIDCNHDSVDCEAYVKDYVNRASAVIGNSLTVDDVEVIARSSIMYANIIKYMNCINTDAVAKFSDFVDFVCAYSGDNEAAIYNLYFVCDIILKLVLNDFHRWKDISYKIANLLNKHIETYNNVVIHIGGAMNG